MSDLPAEVPDVAVRAAAEGAITQLATIARGRSPWPVRITDPSGFYSMAVLMLGAVLEDPLAADALVTEVDRLQRERVRRATP